MTDTHVNSVIHQGDCLEVLRTLPSESVHCCVTSPPYWGLRDYGCDGQLGLEKSPEEYVTKMTDVFREVRRVLRNDGTLWLNIGDSYAAQRGGSVPPAETLAGGKNGWTEDGQRTNRDRHDGYNPSRNASKIGLKHKDLVGIPWRLAFALQSDGWYLRQDIIWHKPNPMPESVRDRCTKAHEYVFLMSKSARYWWDAGAVSEKAVDPGVRISTSYGNAGTGKQSTTPYVRQDDGTRNRRSVWTVATQPCKEAHFAVMPQKLVEPCILAGCPEGCTVLDPFFGAGTVGLVASKLGRKFIGIELNPEYVAIANARINAVADKMPLLECVSST